MTATPRYFQEHVKRRAAELEFELVSMDDAHVFGPEFHVLTFHEAISAKPEPLLTDDQVVVIGVTDREAKAWAERATLVRMPPVRRGSPDPAETPDRRSPLPLLAGQEDQMQRGDLRSVACAGSGDPRTTEEAEGFTTDARTLAAQIGLAKAMRKYDLRKLITFHSSVAKAARFVDATRRDSLPGVIPHLTRSARPSGKLWTKHISGHTPAGNSCERNGASHRCRGVDVPRRKPAASAVPLSHLPEDTRGILSNCACLGEGVDVPVLDGVAFMDPKHFKSIRVGKGKCNLCILAAIAAKSRTPRTRCWRPQR